MGEGCVVEEGCFVEEIGFGEGFLQVINVAEEDACFVGGRGVEGDGGVEECCCIEEGESFVRVIGDG